MNNLAWANENLKGLNFKTYLKYLTALQNYASALYNYLYFWGRNNFNRVKGHFKYKYNLDGRIANWRDCSLFTIHFVQNLSQYFLAQK